jgi:hypothetical protein
MKGLMAFLWVTVAALQAQQTASIPLIIRGNGSSSVQASDIAVDLNNVPATVELITPLTGAHLQYVLLNDQSGKTAWPGGTKAQADAAAQLLTDVIVPGNDIGTLVNFSHEAYVDAIDETDPVKISAKLVRQGAGETRLFDALVRAANWLNKQTAEPNRRKVMFLFSDGEDNASEANSRRAIETLQRGGVPLFVFAPSSVEKDKHGRVLRQLAEESGGRLYIVKGDPKSVEFESLKHDLANSFLVTVKLTGRVGIQPLKINSTNPNVSLFAPSRVAVH